MLVSKPMLISKLQILTIWLVSKFHASCLFQNLKFHAGFQGPCLFKNVKILTIWLVSKFHALCLFQNLKFHATLKLHAKLLLVSKSELFSLSQDSFIFKTLYNPQRFCLFKNLRFLFQNPKIHACFKTLSLLPVSNPSE